MSVAISNVALPYSFVPIFDNKILELVRAMLILAKYDDVNTDITADVSQYIHDIIQTYNNIRSSHIALFRRLSNHMGVPYPYSFKPIEMSDVPMSSEKELLNYMRSLKINIISMKRREYNLIQQSHRSDLFSAMYDYYENILNGKVDLMPNRTNFNNNIPIIAQISDIFNPRRNTH
jgi:hypothetical protein